ncbi:phosphomannose isomerase [Marinitoga piezophila KA3]|uniref:Phosphomannose isomerase n=1 Tax=Marinitoga piezophila (strain DSM 14283 / JCM 11233 / KA3) TaxID=443254 RepID=H2J5G8_MARPK|nr:MULTISPECIES: type I phosphomannose isomerase catalytic subunit [Marinitoga]AEX86112.1 phosphomannose isomerase [Marinitoga piezophila KA3]
MFDEILKSKPIFVEKVWGDFSLNKDFNIENMDKIGEVWLFSGFEGYETELYGMESNNSYGKPSEYIKDIFGMELPRIPLLLKLISTTQWLSIQVHPDDDIARNAENEPWGKTEAWYFLNEKNEIFISNDVEKNKKAIESENWDEVFKPTILNKNDLLFIPAGVVHTLGPDSKLLEIQQTSNLTYRLYDWGRPREIHVEKGKNALKNCPFVIANSPKEFKTQYFTIFEKDNGETIKGPGIFVEFETYETFIIPFNLEYTTKKKGLFFTL